MRLISPIVIMLLTGLLSTVAYAYPKELRLAVDKGWAPYVYIDDNDAICGTDATLLLTILDKLRVAVRRIDIPSQRLKVKINKGEVDVVVGAAKNEERLRKNLFSDAYRTEKISYAYIRGAYIQPDDPIEILLDTGSVVAANMAGWFGAGFEALKQQYRGQLVHVEEHERALRMLRINRLHAMVGDKHSLRVMIDEVASGEMLISNTIIHQQPVYFMFSRSSVDRSFLNEFNAHLQNRQKVLVDRCQGYRVDD